MNSKVMIASVMFSCAAFGMTLPDKKVTEKKETQLDPEVYKSFCAAKSILHHLFRSQETHRDPNATDCVALSLWYTAALHTINQKRLIQGLVMEFRLGVPKAFYWQGGRWEFCDASVSKGNGEKRLREELMGDGSSGSITWELLEHQSPHPALKEEWYQINKADQWKLPPVIWDTSGKKWNQDLAKALWRLCDAQYESEYQQPAPALLTSSY